MDKSVTPDHPVFSADVLLIDPEQETARIERRLRAHLAGALHRRGVVLGLSGGVDSCVTAALAARALGPERVLALEMPERESAPDSLALSALAASHLGIQRICEDITPPLEAVGFYRRYAEAVRQVVPEYGEGWASKIIIEESGTRSGFHLFSLVARSPLGVSERHRLQLRPYLEIVAATNFKQRIRKMLEYYHADRLNYAVLGTPNRLEYDQGFFVKGGDGAADVKPIAHLYKTQVYQLAEFLGIPEEIRRREPTTDTYSLPQGQDEFFFSLPYRQMDLCLYGRNHGVAPDMVAQATGLSTDDVEGVYRNIERKRATTHYLHLPPLLTANVPEVLRGEPRIQEEL
jgi:NAD+ synthase